MWLVFMALRRPYTIAVLAACIALMAVLSVRGMRRDILPDIDIPVVIVVWNYPGLGAEDMERRVVLLSERAYSSTVGGISKIESQSLSGVGLLKLYFEPDADIGAAIAQVASVSQTASRGMPPGMQPPIILQYNAANVPVAQLTLQSSTLSEQQLFDYGLNFLRIRLFTVPGLSLPAPYGGKQRQIMVDVDPIAVAAHGLSAQDVLAALLQANLIVPAGAMRVGDTEYDVTINNSPSTVEAFGRLPIRVVRGAPVLVRDVANVRDGFAVQQNIVRIDGRRATYLTLLKKANASTLAVVDAARDMLPAIRAAAPAGIEISLDYDQSVFVRGAIAAVLHEGLVSTLLVSLMIFIFLGSWRSMVIVATSIPLALGVALVALKLCDYTLNLMSLGGLALAIGMLVDDATVEVENIHRNRGLGRALVPAILHGAQEIATPALAATLTICIVFTPVLLLEGPVRFLFTPLALSVVAAMLASYGLSRTLVPTLARLLLAHEPHQDAAHMANAAGLMGAVGRWREAALGRLLGAYGRLLVGLLKRPGLVLFAAVAVLGLTVALAGLVGTDFFPPVDAGQMRLHVRAPIGTRIESTENLVAAVEQEIRALVPAAELDAITSQLGMPTVFNLAFVQSDNIGGQDAEIRVALAAEHAPTLQYQRQLRQRLAARFPGSDFYFQPADIITQVLNFGLSAPLAVEIEGADLEVDMQIARQIHGRLSGIAGVVDVRIPQALSHPAVQVEVDRVRAAAVGISQRDIANNLLTTLSSSSLVAPSFWLSPENQVNYLVAVQTPTEQVDSVDALMQLGVSASSVASTDARAPARLEPERPIPLAAVAVAQVSQSKSLISHSTVQRVVEVLCGLEGRDLGSVARDIERSLAQLTLPKGHKVRLRGQSASMQQAFVSLGLGLVVAIALVYLLLVALFQSFLDPLIVMIAVPGALTGVVLMLAVTGSTLNVESMMGTIMAVGVAVSNSILLVSFANEQRRERADLSAPAAALLAGQTRLRPVLMTALAMILGMVPMALGSGDGGEQNAPLGRAVIGGLFVATTVTLGLVPVAYTHLRRRRAGVDDDELAAAIAVLS